MKKVLSLIVLLAAFAAPGFAQESITYHEHSAQKAPGYRAPHTAAPRQPRQSGGDHQRNPRNNQREVRNRNQARHNDHRSAQRAYRNGRFNDRYFGSHFGPRYVIVFGGPGFWYGAPYVSPFFFGGVYFNFGPFVFLPGYQIGGWYIDYCDYASGYYVGSYVLINPAFPGVIVPVVVEIDIQPAEEQ